MTVKLFLIVALFFILSTIGGTSSARFKGQEPSSPLSSKPKINSALQKRIVASKKKNKAFKIWIYFTDKGLTAQGQTQKKLDHARRRLKKRCLKRRMKVRSKENLVDFEDLSLFQPYLEKVKPLVKRVRTKSRWLNAISAEATHSQIIALTDLEFIGRIDPILTFRRDVFPPTPKEGPTRVEKIIPFSDYGPSFAQLDQINVIPLHKKGYSGKGILVCMLDAGYRKSHEIFQHANVVDEWDFVNNDGDVEQDLLDPTDYSDSHGTGTWSILGGFKPGELVGPAYGADFLLAKTETTLFEQQIEEDYWVAGIEWAEGLGAEVVSSSLGYLDWYTFADMDGKTAVTTKAANRAVSLGVVVVTAVGNERDKSWGHLIAPSDGFDVIAVGAVDKEGQFAPFSSPGPTFDGRIKPEVCALGVDNWRATNTPDGNDIYKIGSGTSFATPLVAGVVALLLQIHPDWTPTQVRTALLSTADRAQNPDNDFGWGIIDAAAAASQDRTPPLFLSHSIDSTIRNRVPETGIER